MSNLFYLLRIRESVRVKAFPIFAFCKLKA